HNRGAEPAELHLLPTLWFRNVWSWGGYPDKPVLQQLTATKSGAMVKATDAQLGQRYFCCDGNASLLFTENETNTQRIFGVANRSPYVKDSINNYIVHGQKEAVSPEHKGTKVAAHYRLTVNAGGCEVVRLRLSDVAPARAGAFGKRFDEALEKRRDEA